MHRIKTGSKVRNFCLVAGFVLAGCAHAKALCIYDGAHFTKSQSSDFGGRLYAKTSLADEFADSALVIKGTVQSSREIAGGPDDSIGVAYRVRVDQVFKGKAPKELTDYSDRDSGGFYLGEGGEGREYLLFLNPLGHDHWAVKRVPGAFEVNYACGQTRPWQKLSAADRQELSALSAKAK